MDTFLSGSIVPIGELACVYSQPEESMLSTRISFCHWLWDLQFFDHLKQVSINFHNQI